MNLLQRINQLEKRKGPASLSVVQKEQVAEALTMDQLNFLEVRRLKIKRGEPAEDTPEYQEILRCVEGACEAIAWKLTPQSKRISATTRRNAKNAPKRREQRSAPKVGKQK